jgi:hypothetical protein
MWGSKVGEETTGEKTGAKLGYCLDGVVKKLSPTGAILGETKGSQPHAPLRTKNPSKSGSSDFIPWDNTRWLSTGVCEVRDALQGSEWKSSKLQKSRPGQGLKVSVVGEAVYPTEDTSRPPG